MIYKEKPSGFSPKFEIVSCYVDHKGKMLLLHRQDHKPQGNTWGVPAGKVDQGEELIDSVIREFQEETGLKIPSEQFSYITKLYVKFPEFDFIYHIFTTKLTEEQTVTINNEEHKDFKWATPKEALKMPLIEDEDFCIKLVYKI